MTAERPHATPDSDEVAALRTRVAELERTIETMQAVLDSLPYGVFWKDRDLVYLGCNRFMLTATVQGDRASVIGHTDLDQPWPRAEAEAYMADDREVMTRRVAKPHIIEPVRGAAGETRWVETFKAPLVDARGEVIGVAGTFRDVTERKRFEEAVAAAQREALQALATPLLPVADGVVVMPLIGALDAERATQVMQTLLVGVSRHRARVAILDITGLQIADADAADGLVRAARAIRLLGAEAVLTGVGPAIAQTLVALGADLRDLVIHGDLKAGIAHAIGREPAP